MKGKKEKCPSCEGRGHERDPVFEDFISPDTCGECDGRGWIRREFQEAVTK
jgi:DnaJ-class molecular chaperone